MTRTNKLYDRLDALEAEFEVALWRDLVCGEGRVTRRLIGRYTMPLFNPGRRCAEVAVADLEHLAETIRGLRDKLGTDKAAGALGILDGHSEPVPDYPILGLLNNMDSYFGDGDRLIQRLRAFLISRHGVGSQPPPEP